MGAESLHGGAWSCLQREVRGRSEAERHDTFLRHFGSSTPMKNLKRSHNDEHVGKRSLSVPLCLYISTQCSYVALILLVSSCRFQVLYSVRLKRQFYSSTKHPHYGAPAHEIAIGSFADKKDHAVVSTLVTLEIEDPSHVSSSADPHVVVGGGDLTSAVLGIIKGMVGPAILYLPHGFATSGYIGALSIMMLSTLMYIHSSRCLLDAWKLETSKDKEQEVMPLQSTSSADQQQEPQQQHTPLSYPELAFCAFGSRGETLVKLGIAAMQSGVCLTYLIFVPHNLHSSVKATVGVDVPPQYWLIVMVLIQSPLSWI